MFDLEFFYRLTNEKRLYSSSVYVYICIYRYFFNVCSQDTFSKNVPIFITFFFLERSSFMVVSF